MNSLVAVECVYITSPPHADCAYSNDLDSPSVHESKQKKKEKQNLMPEFGDLFIFQSYRIQYMSHTFGPPASF